MVFRPGRWPTLLTLALFGVLISLGFWQLDRAEQKRALLDVYRSGRPDTVIQLEAKTRSLEGLQYQYATARGQYDSDHQFLLDNRTYKGRVGYQVLTPLVLGDTRTAVLVNRGWVALGQSRDVLPNVSVQGAQREVFGRIREPRTSGFRLGEEQPRERWPYRIQQVDLDRLARELGYSLLPLTLLLDETQADGFVRDWHPLTFGPERNTGYAVQWFSMALALLIIYVFVNVRKLDTHDD